MAVAFVQAKYATTAAASVGVSLTGVGAGNHLAACGGSFGGASSLTTSTPSATWSNSVADFNWTGTSHLRGDYTENVASGSWTVTANSSGASNTAITAYETSGVATSSSKGVSGTGSSATTTVSLTSAVTPSANSMLITFATDDGSSGSTADTITSSGNSPFTVDFAGGAGGAWDEGGIPQGGAHFAGSAASSTNITWTGHNTGVAHMGTILMEFLAAAGAATTATILTRTLRGTGF